MAAGIIIKKQITVDSWDDCMITGFDCEGKATTTLLPDCSCYRKLPSLLYKGCKLNILSSTVGSDETLHPMDIILDPDYLLDISALARCVQPYGKPAIGYILNIIEKSEESSARLLGEAANIFLDDCANECKDAEASYRTSMEKFFREYPLQLSACENIDREFFDNACRQFYNIKEKIGFRNIDGTKERFRKEVFLEPSFFCEPLGLQGRIDLLQGDYRMLIELKSGKADDYNNCGKREHRIQMSLYKEMLYYCMNIPREEIATNLFYSRYPRFYREGSSQNEISNILMLRNEIVTLLKRMGENGLFDILRNLNPDELNEYNNYGRLWSEYLRPRIVDILQPVRKADNLLCQYVFGNIAFVAREMQIAKTGEQRDSARHSTRSFADVWNTPLQTKIEEGNILIDLGIKEIVDDEGISDVIFEIKYIKDDYYPNFRAGDTVFVYKRNGENDNATNRQVIRGTLSSITPEALTLHLRHKQRNSTLFDKNTHYAIEHDHLDSTFRASIRDLYSLLSAPKQRTGLILAQREPTFNTSLTLNGDYGNSYINDIVLKAKQAKELFLLVGPPGTGKTSQALSSMVREFTQDSGCNILLASYTNRAIDEICQTLERLPEKPQYIRIGSEQNCSEAYAPRLLKNVIAECKNREQIRHKINGIHLFVGTIASLSSRKELFKLKKFNIAIIDEATQILESQMAGLLAAVSPDGTSAIEKFILIGDPKQLPAVVAQPADSCIVQSEQLREIGVVTYSASLFERLYYRHQQKPVEGLVATLYKQGRMHPTVGEFANKHFYGGTLVPIPLPHQCENSIYGTVAENSHYQQLLATRRTAFIATGTPQGNEIAKVNRPEADEIALLVKAYYELHTANGIACNPSKEIGIIVPFRNQIAMVAHAIAKLNIPDSNGIVIDTVERFQGSQREMILFGTTVWRPEQMDMLSLPITDAEGNVIDRKLNVALTRARRRMYIFGNRNVLSASPIYKALMDELE